MRIRWKCCSIATLVAVFGATTPAFADSRLTYKVVEGSGGSMQTLLIGHGKFRIDANEGTAIVVDPATSVMTVIDHKGKTFMRIGRTEIDQIVGMMKQLEQAMAGMPPEMREKMKSMIGGGPAISVVNTGRKDSVAGRACTISETKLQEQTIAESCEAPFASLGLPAADLATVTKASQMFKEIAEKLAAGPMAGMVRQIGISGDTFPLRSTMIQGTQRSTSELVSVEQATLSADLFAVPAGYKEQKLEMPKIGK